MKTIYIFLFFSIISPITNSQMIFFAGFDSPFCLGGSGCSPLSYGWTITQTGFNGITSNKWYVSGTSSGQPGNCDAMSSTDQTLHIANDSGSTSAWMFCPNGDCGAAYDATDSSEITDVRVESPIINLSGKNNVLLSFHYIKNGENSDDNAEVWYYDGSSWSMLADPPTTTICGGFLGLWETFSVILPASADNNPDVRIGFRWINDGDGIGTDPSISINDISLINNFNSVPEENFPQPEILVNSNTIYFSNTSESLIEITDFSGRIVHRQKNELPVLIPVSGIYFIKIIHPDFIIVRKINIS